MQNTVTVEKAIRRGKWIIIYPSFLIFALGIFLTICISVIYDNLKFATTGIVLGILLPFVYRFFVITPWKIWAFENVRNVHQLRQKAYEEGLTFSQDNVNFFEFRSTNQKEKLKKLDEKFLQEDVFQDDLLLSKEMIIYFSIFKAVCTIIIWGSIGFGSYIYFASIGKKAIIIVLLVVYIVFLNIRNLVNRNPQIKLSNKGIQLKSEEFFSWGNIRDEKLVVERNYGRLFKRRKKYLTFFADDSYQSILIDPLNISFDDLENALQVYRVRYENENSN